MIPLGNLPAEIFGQIVEDLVITIGIYKVLRMRLVNKLFNETIVSVISNDQVVDIFDPATPKLVRRMSSSLLGQILLKRSHGPKAARDRDGALYAIALANRALDSLITRETEEERKNRHRRVAEQVANTYLYRNVQMPDWVLDDQIVLSGAVMHGCLSLVRNLVETRLLSHTLDDWTKYFGRPLHLAAVCGHIDVVRYLLSCGANPRLLNETREKIENDKEEGRVADWSNGQRDLIRFAPGTALRAAVSSGNEELASLLLQRENRVQANHSEFCRTMTAAVQTGRLDIFKMLDSVLVKETARPWTQLWRAKDAMLCEATMYGRVEMVRMLLDGGANVNSGVAYSKGIGQGPALHIATARGYTDIVRLLLERGSNWRLEGFTSYGRGEPVTTAARNGNLEIVRIFLAQGAKPARALRHAIQNGHVHLVSWLIETYPDLLSKSYFLAGNATIGSEALERAIYCQNPPLISLLVSAGVPLNRPTEGGEPPSVPGMKFSAKWIVDYLVKIGAEDPRGREITEEQAGNHADSDELSGICRGGVKVSKRTWQWVGRY